MFTRTPKRPCSRSKLPFHSYLIHRASVNLPSHALIQSQPNSKWFFDQSPYLDFKTSLRTPPRSLPWWGSCASRWQNNQSAGWRLAIDYKSVKKQKIYDCQSIVSRAQTGQTSPKYSRVLCKSCANVNSSKQDFQGRLGKYHGIRKQIIFFCFSPTARLGRTYLKKRNREINKINQSQNFRRAS